MANQLVYTGPADNLIIDGKLYHPGDAVPMTVEQRRRHETQGHRFTDSDLDEIAQRIAAQPPAAPDTRPRGDRGEVLEMDDARKAPTVPELAPAARQVEAKA